MRSRYVIAAFHSALALVALCVSACATQPFGAKENEFRWEPPPQGVIRSGAAAIAIARVVWFSMQPTLPKASEQSWQQDMTATLSNGVWHVRQKPPGPNAIGGGLEIELNAKDAKVVRIILVQ